MDMPAIKAWPREERGTHASRRLRKRGLVPVVLYGRGEPNVLLSARENAISRLIAEHASIVRVEWNGHSTPTQLKEVQYDSLGDAILHVDFGRISLAETVRVSVRIEPHGEPVGVKEKDGVLEIVLHEIEVECLPTNIPETIRVEVAGLDIGDDIRLGSLALPEGVVAVGDPDAVVLAVAMPTEIIEEAPASPEELMAEPEVIGREEPEAEEGRGAQRSVEEP